MYLKIIVFIIFNMLLSGCLPTIFAGAAGTTIEFAKDQPAKNTVNDIKISAAIQKDFITNNFRNLYAKIKVSVIQGRVFLTGSIDKKEDAIHAVKIAWNQKGVVEVINELQIDKKSNQFNIVQYARDTLITGQIKSSTLIDNNIKFSNYTVITINDIVYLFGIARSEKELKRIANIASSIRGVKKVVSHIKIVKLLHVKGSKKNDKEDEILTLENIKNG